MTNDLPASVDRRTVLERLMLLAAAPGVSTLAAGCGGGGAALPPPLPIPPPAAVPAAAPPVSAAPAPAPAPTPAPAPPAPSQTPVSRLRQALGAAPLVPSPTPVDVDQSASQATVPMAGPTATMVPPWGTAEAVNSLADASITTLWGFRRDTWTRQGTKLLSLAPVSVDHASSSAPSSGVCGLHFEFEGRAFELLMAGTDCTVVLVADGRYMTPRHISQTWSAGVPGRRLTGANAFLRFDFGTRARRKVSVYALSSQGPCSVAIAAGDSIAAWDRSAEPSMCVMADSYGQSGCTNWGTGGPFWEAAALLGIPHVDRNAVGGTGYAPNNVRLAADSAFGGRIGSSTKAAPDLFLTAGGVNDNNWLALPPYATAEAARQGFDGAVTAYFADLRSALPAAVLVALGPWTPPRDPSSEDVVQAKVRSIRTALAAVAGPWIFIDNVNGGWVNSAGAQAPAGGGRWQTGKGWASSPANDGGNSDRFIADGTHPNEAGCAYLAEQIATHLRAGLLAL